MQAISTRPRTGSRGLVVTAAAVLTGFNTGEPEGRKPWYRLDFVSTDEAEYEFSHFVDHELADSCYRLLAAAEGKGIPCLLSLSVSKRSNGGGYFVDLVGFEVTA